MNPPSQAEYARKKVTSSVRNALQFTKQAGKAKGGLLNWFQLGTKADTKAYWDRQEEEASVRRSEEDYVNRNKAAKKKAHERELVRIRVQKHRTLKKESEVKNGTRSPGGTKRKVCS
jgi:hypothetical protein